jgi:hypothetical protein
MGIEKVINITAATQLKLATAFSLDPIPIL